ncbi:MAG TPA: TetR/AcrR family transcriptional regulator [Smithellaceae bacterium]|nr:TetR/AcrR family transcriptional regulator [Smithellaceae bacterium]
MCTSSVKKPCGAAPHRRKDAQKPWKGRSEIVTTLPEPAGDSRTNILEAAAKVFLRYGYKKTSMDDLARATGFSRQGLYLHFKTKEELFRAAILNIVEAASSAYRTALDRSNLDFFERLLGAFEAFHGSHIGQFNEQYVDEILTAASSLLGDAPAQYEKSFIADVTKLIADAGGSRLAGLEAGAQDVAEMLCATSYGWKHRVATPAEYRDRMAIALRITFRGEQPGPKNTCNAVSKKKVNR